MKGMQYRIAYSMGKARRNSLTNKNVRNVPGPGGYNEGNMNRVRHENPKWSIKGKGKTQQFTKDGPGPGQYVGDFK